jgi:hypothetical protein
MLYGPDGLPITREDGSSMAGAQGIVSMIVNDNVSRFARGDRFGSQAIAWHTPLLHEDFEGTVISTARWVTALSGMAVTQSNAGWTLNSGNSVVAGAFAIVTSLKRFQIAQRAPLGLKFRRRISNIQNTVHDFGYGTPSGVVAVVPNGAYFQKNAGGELLPIISYNGSITATGPDAMPALLAVDGGLNASFVFDIFRDDDAVKFTVQRTDSEAIIFECEIRIPNTQAKFSLENHLPVFDRLYNSPTAPIALATTSTSDVYVYVLDQATGKTRPQQQAEMGKSSSVNPASGVQLASFANNTAPVNANLLNTAPSYAAPHGLFSFVPLAGAVTDYLLFYHAPPGGFSFNVTEVLIDLWNTGTTIATTPTLCEWFIVSEMPGANLAAGGIREHLGSQSLAVGTINGGQADRSISRSFQTPIVTNPGRGFGIGLRMPVATVTVGSVIQGAVHVRGYNE